MVANFFTSAKASALPRYTHTPPSILLTNLQQVAAGLGEEEGPAGGGRMSRQQLVVGEALRERSVAQVFAGIEVGGSMCGV